MKKVTTIIATTLAALSIFGFAGSTAITAEAAGEYKNAVFENGVYATNGAQSLAIFFYKSGKNKLVYLNDGTTYAYSEYTMKDAQVPGFGEGTKLTVGEFVLYDFVYNGSEYILTDDGVLYNVDGMTAYEAQQIRDAF